MRDYNGDGLAELAIGAPFENVLSVVDGTQKVDAGAVSVIYATSIGLSAVQLPYPYTKPAAQFWTQDSLSIRDVAQAGDQFGRSLY